MTTDTATLEAELREAQDRLAAVQAEAERHRQEEAQRRAERLAEDDRARLASFDEEALRADVRAAEEELRRAIRDSPVGVAAARLRAAQDRRAILISEVNSAASRLGQPPAYPHHTSGGSLNLDEFTRNTIERESGRIVADETDEREAAREAALARDHTAPAVERPRRGGTPRPVTAD